jgi:hypothetical protein
MKLVVAMATLLLTPTAVQAQQLPSNWKSQIRAYINENFHDPRSVQDMRVTAPFADRANDRPATSVCVSLRARTPMGGLMLNSYDAVFQNTRLVYFVGGSRHVCKYPVVGPF